MSSGSLAVNTTMLYVVVPPGELTISSVPALRYTFSGVEAALDKSHNILSSDFLGLNFSIIIRIH